MTRQRLLGALAIMSQYIHTPMCPHCRAFDYQSHSPRCILPPALVALGVA